MRCLVILSILLVACEEKPTPFAAEKEPASGTGDLNACNQGEVSASCPVITSRPSPQPEVSTDPKTDADTETDADTDTNTDNKEQPTVNVYTLANKLELTISPYPHVGDGEIKFTFKAISDIEKKTVGNKRSYTLRIYFGSTPPAKLEVDNVSRRDFFSSTKTHPYWLGARNEEKEKFNQLEAGIVSMKKDDSFYFVFSIETTEQLMVRVNLDSWREAKDKDNNIPTIIPP